MKKLLAFLILLIPFIVSAEDVTYEVCKSGCTYDSVDATYQAIKTLDTSKQYNITINIKDGETYNIQQSTLERNFFNGNNPIKDSSILVKGTGSTRPTITSDSVSYNLNVICLKNVTLDNVNFESNNAIYFSAHGNSVGVLNIKNSNIKAPNIDITGDDSILDNVNASTSDFHFQPAENRNNSVIKNSKIGPLNSTNDNKVTIRFYAKIENTEITAPIVESFDGLTLIDSTVNGNISAYKPQIYKNTKINGHVSLVINKVEFDNVEITDGLDISRTYCENDSESFFNDYQSYIKNSKIHGENPLVIRSRERYVLMIDNTDLDDSSNHANSCSVVTIAPAAQYCPKSNPVGKKIMPSYLGREEQYNQYGANFNISVFVNNSKINCAATYSDAPNIQALNQFIDYQTKWSKPIVRGDTLEGNVNVVEKNDGIIFIENAATDTLVLNVDLEKPIADYFKDILPEGSVLGNWFIEDESILKVENNKIVPLKVGTTAIYGVVDNNVYSVFITVTDDMVNPGTGYNMSNVIILIVVLTLIAIIIHFKKPIKIE